MSESDPVRTSGLFNVRCPCESKTQAFTNSRRFVDYLLCGVVNYDWRLEILKLRLTSEGGLNSFLKFRSMPQLRSLHTFPIVDGAAPMRRFIEQECFTDQVWISPPARH